MNTNSNNIGVTNSWSLLTFAADHGKMKVAPFANKETGEVFKSCAFVDSENNVTLVGFSSNLGELTPAQISSMKHELQVVQLTSGSYKLCKVGNSSWEDVQL